jgi:hypothetical protein
LLLSHFVEERDVIPVVLVGVLLKQNHAVMVRERLPGFVA